LYQHLLTLTTTVVVVLVTTYYYFFNLLYFTGVAMAYRIRCYYHYHHNYCLCWYNSNRLYSIGPKTLTVCLLPLVLCLTTSDFSNYVKCSYADRHACNSVDLSP